MLGIMILLSYGTPSISFPDWLWYVVAIYTGLCLAAEVSKAFSKQ